VSPVTIGRKIDFAGPKPTTYSRYLVLMKTITLDRTPISFEKRIVYCFPPPTRPAIRRRRRQNK